MPAHHNKPKRTAHIEIRYAKIVLKLPERVPEAKGELLKEVTLSAIWIYEPKPLEKVTGLERMLLANMNILSQADALKIGKLNIIIDY